MNEDYLWDKTGGDETVEGLENALKAFRFEEREPPALPQAVFTLEPEKPRRFLWLRLAFASLGATAAVILALVWLQTAAERVPVAATFPAETDAPKRAEKIANESFIDLPGPPPAKVEPAAPLDKPAVVKARQTNAPAARARKIVRRSPKPRDPAETLTAEEKYAYDQLMLALSITGSKLRIVKDALDMNAGL